MIFRTFLWLVLLCLAAMPAHAETVVYVHTDALGSPVLETDGHANIIRQVDYRAYGEEVMDGPKAGPGYTGHYRDVATDLVYMQQRYYDPVVGRFLSVDPVTADPNTGASFNRYWYADNNPYKFTDPDGRQTSWIFPGHISSSTRLPRNEEEARNWGTAPAVPVNPEAVANDLDKVSTTSGVLAVTSLGALQPEAAAVFGTVEKGAAVAALLISPSEERAATAAMAVVVGPLGSLAKNSIPDQATAQVVETIISTADNASTVVDAAQSAVEHKLGTKEEEGR